MCNGFGSLTKNFTCSVGKTESFMLRNLKGIIPASFYHFLKFINLLDDDEAKKAANAIIKEKIPAKTRKLVQTHYELTKDFYQIDEKKLSKKISILNLVHDYRLWRMCPDPKVCSYKTRISS